MKKIESKEIKKADDKPIKTSDWQQLLKDFIKHDDRKQLLLFTMIELSSREEAETIEHLLLQQFDQIKEEMFMSDFYSKQDLTDVNFLLQFVKLHIQHMDVEDVDVSRGLSDNFLNMFRV